MNNQTTPPTPDKLAEARKLIDEWQYKWPWNSDRHREIAHYANDLIIAQDLLSRAEQKKETIELLKQIAEDKEHLYDRCMGYSEGQECCLEMEEVHRKILNS